MFQAHPEGHRAELHHLLFNCFFLILHWYQFVITANGYCKSLPHPVCMFYVFSFGYMCFCNSISFCCCTKAGSHGLTMLKTAIFDSLGCDMTLTSEVCQDSGFTRTLCQDSGFTSSLDWCWSVPCGVLNVGRACLIS